MGTRRLNGDDLMSVTPDEISEGISNVTPDELARVLAEEIVAQALQSAQNG